MKAMILAAGLGTRLLPYTLKRPKPLFPILNKPLLHLTISRIKQAGALEIIVNAHHLRSQIFESLQAETNITLQEEEKILGTGGGLRLALPHLGSDPLLVVNGDIYHTIDYTEVYNFHCTSGADVTLVLHDYPRFNDVMVDDSRITGFNKFAGSEEKLVRSLAFTGIHVINPEVLRVIPPESPYCIIDCYRKLLQKGGMIGSYVAANHFWTDIGTPADYLQLHADILAHKVPVYEELAETAAAAPFIGLKSASVSPDATLLGWVCIGDGAAVEAGTTLQRTVVWDNAVVPAGSTIIDGIVTA
jgi:mannose-1-phosphate guanylyltransferase